MAFDPEQILDELTVMVGEAITDKVQLTCRVQPNAAPTTLYAVVVVGETTIVEVVCPEFHE